MASRLEYRPELDGLRALAVLSVIVYHLPSGRAVLPAGFIGVDVFFALSGALITQLLLSEHEESGTIALGRFYARRLRRLYPAMLGMVATVVVVTYFAFGAAAFVRSLWNGALSALYLAAFVAPFRAMPGFGHMWSLSIEELFYLVWPATLLGVIRSGRRALVLVLGLVVVSALTWRLHLWFDAMASSNRLYFAPDTRADALAWGCLVGLSVRWGFAARARRALVVLAPGAALGLLLLMLRGDRTETWFATWGYTLTSILASVVVARLFVARSALLSAGPLRWLGKISYSLYLWHVPAIGLAESLGWPPLAGLGVGTGLAIASYYGLESRLRAPPLPPASSVASARFADLPRPATTGDTRAVATFQAQGLTFAFDRVGVAIDAPSVVDIEVSYADAGLDASRAPAHLGERLSSLLGEPVEDEDGHFDLAVTRDGAAVAALVLACEDDALALGGERAASVTDDDLAGALAEALAAGNE